MKADTLTQYIPGTSISFRMIFVAGGPTQLGEDSDAHPATMQPFYLAEFPVTQALWKAVMKGEEHPSYFQGPQRPKTNVSWLDITESFLPVINKQAGFPLAKGQGFRLPSESEWEYAARGGNRSEGFRYAGSHHLDEVGWYDDNSYGETKAVGLKLPNELGLYDMSGNVFEWCEDDWHDDYQNAPADGSAWVDSHKRGDRRVMRGGSYFTSPEYCRAAYRYDNWPGNRSYLVGFRLALSPQFSP